MTIIHVIPLLSLFVVLIYMRFRRKPLTTASAQDLPSSPSSPVVASFRVFTPTALLDFNGVGGKPIYLAVRGRVFDVTKGRNFYGPVINLTIIIITLLYPPKS